MPDSRDRVAPRPSAGGHRSFPRPSAFPWPLLVLVATLAIAPGVPDLTSPSGAVDLASATTETWIGPTRAIAPPQAPFRAPLPKTLPAVKPDAVSHASGGPNGDPVPASVVAMAADGSGARRARVQSAGDHDVQVAAGDPLPIKPDDKPAVATPARWTGGYNLFRKTAFVTQRDFKWCVAASVQMMVNIVRHGNDRTAATQERMIVYAQSNDNGPYGPGGGTDVTGWIVALRHFGAGRYRAVGARTPDAALRIAATAMRQTGRPAGMLVMDGQHAWVLHGFESRTDPLHDRRAKVTSVRVSGPLYPIQQKHGYDMRPNTELSVRALARYFHPSTVGSLVGRYVVIIPTH